MDLIHTTSKSSDNTSSCTYLPIQWFQSHPQASEQGPNVGKIDVLN